MVGKDVCVLCVACKEGFIMGWERRDLGSLGGGREC